MCWVGTHTLSICLYFPISECAVIKHPNTRNFPPGSEVFSKTLVQTSRAFSVWLDWYSFRPFSICCLVWSWPISATRCLIKIFIRLSRALSAARQQASKSLLFTERFPTTTAWRGRCKEAGAWRPTGSQLRLSSDTKETRSTVVKEQQSESIVANDFVETCGGCAGGK